MCKLSKIKNHKDLALYEMEKFLKNELKITATSKDDKYLYIIGESPYPNEKNIIRVSELSSSQYAELNVPEIALFSKNYTVDMFMICGILFGSIDKATQFIKWAVENKHIEYFADFLLLKVKMIFLNRKGENENSRKEIIEKCLEVYKPSKVLFIGKDVNDEILALFDKKMCKIICHCGARPTLQIPEEWCKTYFLRETIDDCTINLKEFMIFS